MPLTGNACYVQVKLYGTLRPLQAPLPPVNTASVNQCDRVAGKTMSWPGAYFVQSARKSDQPVPGELQRPTPHLRQGIKEVKI